MAGYRKLGRTSSQRKALLRSQVTSLIYKGKIVTTQARAKEVQKIVEGLIALAVKEKDNYETVKISAKVPVKDKDGKRVKEVSYYGQQEPKGEFVLVIQGRSMKDLQENSSGNGWKSH